MVVDATKSIFDIHFQLADFSHLFDVSVGINIAYTLLDDLRNYARKGHKAAVDKGMTECKKIGEPGGNSTQLFDYFEHECEKNSNLMESIAEKIVTWMKPWASFSAFILLFLLGWTGFYQLTEDDLNAVANLMGGKKP